MKKPLFLTGFLMSSFLMARADELAATLDDTGLKVANQLIVSPDGQGQIRLLPIENIRTDIDVFEKHWALVFTSGTLTPYLAYASESGNLGNLGSWSGSSRFAIMFTGLHHQQSMAVVYPEKEALRGSEIDLAPLWEFGRKVLPWDEHALDHDAILEVIPGDGDSVTCLYWRTSSGKALAVPVTVSIKDRERPTSVTFGFGEQTLFDDDWLNKGVVRDKEGHYKITLKKNSLGKPVAGILPEQVIPAVSAPVPPAEAR